MDRARRSRHRNSKGLANQIGYAPDVINRGVELGDGVERRQVVDLLINPPKLGSGVAAAREGDHRRVGQVGITQPGCEVLGADHLGHADARFARGAGVSVGHVGGGLLAVRPDAFDAGSCFEFDHRPAEDRRHVEHVSDFVSGQHLGQHPGTGGLHRVLPVDPKTAFPLVVTVPSGFRTQRSSSIVVVVGSEAVTVPPHSRLSPR